MWTKLVISICLILACLKASAYTLDETIAVTGGGDMSVSSDILSIREVAQGIGNQWYHRELTSDANNSKIVSDYTLAPSTGKVRESASILSRLGLDKKYNLNAPVSNSYNMYVIGVNNAWGRLAHQISATWLENFRSNSTIFSSQEKLTTDYNVSGTGVFSEAVINNSVWHPRLEASALVNGNFSVKSDLNAKFKPELDTTEMLKGKLDQMTANDTSVNVDKNKTNTQGVDLDVNRPLRKTVNTTTSHPTPVVGSQGQNCTSKLVNTTWGLAWIKTCK